MGRVWVKQGRVLFGTSSSQIKTICFPLVSVRLVNLKSGLRQSTDTLYLIQKKSFDGRVERPEPDIHIDRRRL